MRPAVVLLTLAGGLVAQSSGARSAGQQVVLSYFRDVLDGRRVELLEILFRDDCVIHRPEGTLHGLPGIRGVVTRNVSAYSKFETEVHDIFESGDRVVTRISHRATGNGIFRVRASAGTIPKESRLSGAPLRFSASMAERSLSSG